MKNNPSEVTLLKGPLSLVLRPDIGGSIAAFRHEDKDILRAFNSNLPEDPLNMASFPLTPYSNRIINCKLKFNGQEFYVGPPFGQEPHQLHGDGWLLPWQVEEQGDDYATLFLRTESHPNTPYIYESRQQFVLADDKLTITMTIKNCAGQALPFGLGQHFYFPRIEETVFKANLPKVWRNRNLIPEDLIPVPPQWDFSKGVVMRDANFAPAVHGFKGQDLMDHGFQGWDGKAEITQPNLHITMRADTPFKNFVIYIPDGKPFFCAEPVTNINDGFNLAAQGVPNTNMLALEPKQQISGQIFFIIN